MVFTRIRNLGSRISVSRSLTWVPLKGDSFPLSWLDPQVLFQEERFVGSRLTGVQFKVIGLSGTLSRGVTI